MANYTTIRHQRCLVAAIVVAAHLVMAWLWMMSARAPSRALDPAAQSVPIYARIIDRPRPQPLGTPAPVKITLIPVTRPKLPTPVIQLIEIEILDSRAPGPDPAPSSAQLVTRPGPANGGGQGNPVSMGSQQLKLVRRVAPAIPPDLARRFGLAGPVQMSAAGPVQLNVRVDERGRVAEVKLLRSSGIERLDAAATRAVGKWRFEPLVQNGRPVSVWTQVNVDMSAYDHKYCRISDGALDDSTDEEVHDASGVVLPLGSEVVLRNLIDELSPGGREAPGPIQDWIRDWGPVESIRYTGDGGIQGWVSRAILPAFQQGHPNGIVDVRSDTYLVRQERQLSRWRVESDRAGEIWCVHVGPVPRIN
jgi:periplasmic protein TonB